MKDDDGTGREDLTEAVDFLFGLLLLLVGCDGDERFDESNVLSLLDLDERIDEDFVTRDVIIGGAVFGSDDVFEDKDEAGGDGESLPMLEHGCASRASGL